MMATFWPSAAHFWAGVETAVPVPITMRSNDCAAIGFVAIILMIDVVYATIGRCCSFICCGGSNSPRVLNPWRVNHAASAQVCG
jgi:hypothetical protein